MDEIDELVAFLRERLGEDERAAQHAEAEHGADWSVHAWGPAQFRRAVVEGSEHSESSGLHGDNELWETEGALGTTEPAAVHMAHYDPARMLREIEAKRRIVDEYEGEVRRGPAGPREDFQARHGGILDAYLTTLRLLALPYSDHPDLPPGVEAVTRPTSVARLPDHSFSGGGGSGGGYVGGGGSNGG